MTDRPTHHPPSDPEMIPTRSALTRIRNRPRVNPVTFGLPDSTELIREDRDR